MADGRKTVNLVHKKRRWFESTHPHINGLFEYRLVREIFILKRGVRLSYRLLCRYNSIGRASDFHSESCEFEPRYLLNKRCGSSAGQNTSLSRQGSRVRVPSVPQWIIGLQLSWLERYTDNVEVLSSILSSPTNGIGETIRMNVL